MSNTAKTWLTPTDVATDTEHSRDYIRRCLVTDELHGHQPHGFRGHWRIHRDAVDAWMRGEDGRVACGCRHLRIKKTA